MTGFLVLSDSVVRAILIDLPRLQILRIQDALMASLVEYSTGSTHEYQPDVAIVNRPEGQKCLFRPFTSSTGIGTKVIVDPAPSSSAAGALHGIIAICDPNGLPRGIINAEEITGYRTSLIAMVPFLWRRNTENIVIFGAGKQALWHVRLALALRGDEIRTITLINRSAQRAKDLIAKVNVENKQYWKSQAVLEYLDSLQDDYPTIVDNRLGKADAIFCAVGTSTPLFSVGAILGDRSRKTFPYISAIGSWQADMLELDPDLLDQVTRGIGNGFRCDGNPGGSVLVDDRNGALQHSGEIVQSQINKTDLIELGQIESLKQQKDGAHLQEWLTDGLLIYKSVGVSITDLAASEIILDLAAEKGLGLVVDSF